MIKRILIIVLIIFAILQLFQPDRNLSSENLKSDIANHYNIPDSIENLINTSCYDCHSNNTDYPWFINVQPIGWYMQAKVTRGKQHLNFSEFGTLKKEIAIRRLTEIDEVMKRNIMPLKAYKFYNSSSNLTEGQRSTISKWAQSLRDKIEIDSVAALSKDTLTLKALK